jgi:DNA-binding transcriptional regulator WhiA
MFFNYISGKYGIPEELFTKWQGISKVDIGYVKRINVQRYMQKEIPKINLDENFAEILGIINGDGYVSAINYEISVIGNSREIDYLNYIKNLFEKNLGIYFKPTFGNGAFKLRAYSSQLFNLLTKEYGLPYGNKMGKLKVPKQLKSNKNFLIPYIRGLFDTDGTIYVRRKKDLVLEISSADKRYLKEVATVLASFGFNVKIYNKHLSLYNKKDILSFFNIIQPANTKHLKKYKEYLKLSASGLPA